LYGENWWLISLGFSQCHWGFPWLYAVHSRNITSHKNATMTESIVCKLRLCAVWHAHSGLTAT